MERNYPSVKSATHRLKFSIWAGKINNGGPHFERISIDLFMGRHGCVAAVLLFDAFSQRKKRQIAHWIFVACFAFLDATLLNLMSPNMANFGKIVIAVAVYYFFHRLLYIGRRVFSLYIAVIFYATICCIDNIWFTFWV